MPWIMEVICACKKCRGTLNVDGSPCDECGAMGEAWYPVNSASKGIVYSYETKEHAGHILRICYREAIRDWNLGGRCTARIREVVDVPEPGTPGPR